MKSKKPASLKSLVDQKVKLDTIIKNAQREMKPIDEKLKKYAVSNPDKTQINGTHLVVNIQRYVTRTLDQDKLKAAFGNSLDPYYRDTPVIALKISHV